MINNKKIKFQGILQEILGFFAGSEGIALILNNLYHDIKLLEKKNNNIITVPSVAATFMCPAYAYKNKDFNLKNDVYYNPGKYALIKRLDIQKVLQQTLIKETETKN